MLMGGDELNVRANLGYFTQPISVHWFARDLLAATSI